MTDPTAAPRLDPRRRALLLLVGSGAALVGVLVLAGLWVWLGVGTVRAGAVLDEPCLAAYDAASDDADIRYEAFPPQAVCSWTVDGQARDVVLQQAPTAVWGTAAAAALAGTALVVGAAVAGRRR